MGIKQGYEGGDRDSDIGAVAVEFALVCILLMIMIVGMVELGRLYAAQLAVTHAAREGARLAAVGKFDDATVREHAYPLDPAVLEIDPVIPTEPDASGEKSVSVTVTYPFEVEILRADWLRDYSVIDVGSTAVMRAEY